MQLASHRRFGLFPLAHERRNAAILQREPLKPELGGNARALFELVVSLCHLYLRATLASSSIGALELSVGAQEIITSLNLKPHPEGGWYRELHRSSLRVTMSQESRCALTSIYYLLQRQESSRWHTVKADEIWHFYAGAPLELFAYQPGERALVRRVLAAPAAEIEPAAVIPAGTWQAARSLGEYSLVGCSVGPGFEFADFSFVSDMPGHSDHFTGSMRPLRELL